MNFSGFWWDVRRELWENRSLYIGPAGAGLLVLVGFFVSLFMRPEVSRAIPVAAGTGTSAIDAYLYAALVIMATAMVVGIFYCLDALYAERRDRSILFWKSLPVSDAVTVLSKAVVAIVVLPIITLGATIAVHLVMLLASSVLLSLRGGDVAALWRAVAPLHFEMKLIYHTLTIHVLWYAPIFAWLLLASAWARRAPFVWAGLPLLGIVVVERLVAGSSRFLEMLRNRTLGGPEMFAGGGDVLGHVSPGVFVQAPGLWIGLIVTAVFLAAAVRMRRSNVPA